MRSPTTRRGRAPTALAPSPSSMRAQLSPSRRPRSDCKRPHGSTRARSSRKRSRAGYMAGTRSARSRESLARYTRPSASTTRSSSSSRSGPRPGVAAGMSRASVQPGDRERQGTGVAAPNRFETARNDGQRSALSRSRVWRTVAVGGVGHDELVLHEAPMPVDAVPVAHPVERVEERGDRLDVLELASGRLAEPELVERRDREPVEQAGRHPRWRWRGGSGAANACGLADAGAGQRRRAGRGRPGSAPTARATAPTPGSRSRPPSTGSRRRWPASCAMSVSRSRSARCRRAFVRSRSGGAGSWPRSRRRSAPCRPPWPRTGRAPSPGDLDHARSGWPAPAARRGRRSCRRRDGSCRGCRRRWRPPR